MYNAINVFYNIIFIWVNGLKKTVPPSIVALIKQQNKRMESMQYACI